MRSSGMIAAVIVAAVFATPILAAPAPNTDQWRDTLDQTSELLKSGRFSDARDRLVALTRVMADDITTPGDADRLFGFALAQLAVAEASIGNIEGAIWHWQIAQNVHPDVRSFDLSLYGDSATVLEANTLPDAPEKCARPANAPAPAVVERSEPKYPKRARQVPVMGLVVVEIEIDAAGRPRRPQVLRSPSAALTYSTLVTLREWRFATPQETTDPVARFCRLFSFGHHK